ncbi:MAG: pilus assembly protein N-terminal domain-containing protein [Shewanella sp.]|nr:pilus assembly protein N-terminal domain-containing protein [Shewanella sp.]MCF1430170.1 pilus assembly protein N-terminal domain-containing protein [Shewanella sp.]MCF1456248.1 pilus assembly protein N-terminal domain-containing protein [Shewanella sp.]
MTSPMWQRAWLLSAMIMALLLPMSVKAQQVTNLEQGGMTTVTVAEDIESVFIADPKVADYQVIDKRRVVVFGKQVGNTSLAVYGGAGRTLASRKIWVDISLDFIRQKVQILHPEAEVNISNIADMVVLSGMVGSEQEKDQINQLVGTLLEKEKQEFKLEWSGEEDDLEMEFMKRFHYDGVVNNIQVAVTKQVNVKLSVAEVSHSFLEEFGIEYGSAGSGTGIFVDNVTSFSASDIVSVITAIGNDTVGRVLAEPNLSVISGESASFLVGGELPVVTVIDGTTNVEYKEFGVRLDLMAKVLKDDQILLSLMPEVSSLDTQYSNTSYDLPALKTRKARTTVQLGDGKSFVLGGLMSTEEKESLSKVPLVGDIPLLGALFRKTGTERSKTELIIVATVNLVQPVEPSLIQLPTINRSSTFQRFFGVESEYQTAAEKWANEVIATGGFKL